MGLAGRGNRLERQGFDFRAAPVAMPAATIFPTIETSGFDHCFTYHAAAILRQDFTDTINELNSIVGGIAIPIVELVRGGGGEARVTQRLRKTFQEHGWKKRAFKVEKRINHRITYSRTHEVDHIKDFANGTVAVEIEWNNKDPFFDRDLENFNRLHADGAISIGVIITRGASFQDGIEKKLRDFARDGNIVSFDDVAKFDIAPTPRQRQAVERWRRNHHGADFATAWAACFTRDKFGAATTHWGKLKSRLDRGVGSPCPTVAFGIPISSVTNVT